MTISSVGIKVGPIEGNGVTVSYPFTFKTFLEADLEVYVTDAAGVGVLQVLDTDYTVVLNADQDTAPGGTLTMATAITATNFLTFRNALTATQGTNLVTGGPYRGDTIEYMADRNALLAQLLSESVSRTMQVSPWNTDTGVDLTLPDVTSRASKFLAFSSTGAPVASSLSVGTIPSTIVEDVTTLRLATVVGGESVFLQHHTTAGDGGHGPLRGVVGAPPGTYVDNNGTVFVPTGGDGSAAYLRDHNGRVNAAWFGVVGSGLVDDVANLQAAIDAGIECTLPDGTYGVSTTLTKDATGFKLEGGSEGGVTIVPLAGFSGDTDSDGNHVLITLGNGVVSRYFNHIRRISFDDPNGVGNVTALYFDRVNNQSRISECNFGTSLARGFEFINLSLANVVERNKFFGATDVCRLTEAAGNSTCIQNNYIQSGRIYLNNSMTGVKIINNEMDGTPYILSDGVSGPRGTIITGNRFESSSATQPVIEMGVNRGTRIVNNGFYGSGAFDIAIDFTNTSGVQSAVVADNYHEGVVTSFVRSVIPEDLVSAYNNRHDPSVSSPTLEYDMNRASTAFEGVVVADQFSTPGSDLRTAETILSKTGLVSGVANVFTITTDGSRGNYSVEFSLHASFDVNSTAVAAGHARYSWAHCTNSAAASVDSAVTVDSALKVAATAPGTRTITSIVAAVVTTSGAVSTVTLNPTLVGVGDVEVLMKVRIKYDGYTTAPVIAAV